MNTRAMLVTSGADFIGSSFVRYWLGAESAMVVNLDELTYGGNSCNLSGLEYD